MVCFLLGIIDIPGSGPTLHYIRYVRTCDKVHVCDPHQKRWHPSVGQQIHFEADQKCPTHTPTQNGPYRLKLNYYLQCWQQTNVVFGKRVRFVATSISEQQISDYMFRIPTGHT